MKRNGKIRRLLVALLSAMMIFAATATTALAGVTDMDPGVTITYKGITAVTINGYKTPVAGEKADASGLTITAEPADSATIQEAKWLNVTSGQFLSSDDVFVKGVPYSLQVTLIPNEGYLFAASTDETYTGTCVITGTEGEKPWLRKIEGVNEVAISIMSAKENAIAADTEDPAKPEDPAEPEDPSDTETAMVPIYRLYLPSTGEHLYTSDKNEYNTLYEKYHWGQEGIAWYAPEDGTEVYRLYQPDLKNHLYTTDKNEVKVLTTTAGWKVDNDNKPLYYSGGDVSIYRVYNRGLSGMHHLTTDLNEYNVLTNGKYGWTKEGAQLSAVKIGEPLTTTRFK